MEPCSSVKCQGQVRRRASSSQARCMVVGSVSSLVIFRFPRSHVALRCCSASATKLDQLGAQVYNVCKGPKPARSLSGGRRPCRFSSVSSSSSNSPTSPTATNIKGSMTGFEKRKGKPSVQLV